MTAPPPEPAEPMTKGTVIHSMAAATRDLWGDRGLRDLSERLGDDARAATTKPDFTPLQWYPTRYVLDWNEALMTGPAAGDEQAFRRGVARSIDLGFGRVRRTLLSFATPTLLAERATQLWSHDHSHGVLSLDSSTQAEGKAVVALAHHPFTTTPLARIAIAEVIRRVLSLSRANNVHVAHAMRGDTLVMALSWDP